MVYWHFDGFIFVLATVEMTSENLVPGDTIVIPPYGCLLTCDVLLLHGTCIVNESVLTGRNALLKLFYTIYIYISNDKIVKW